MGGWTDAKITALRLKEGASEQRVSVERSLYLRLRRGLPSGPLPGKVSKRWEYRAKVNKRSRWLALGEYPGMSLADAKGAVALHQAKADRARKGEGDHPVLEARAARKRSKGEPTLRDVADEWLATADLRESTKALHRGNLKADVFDRIGDARMKHLTTQHFRDCIDAPLKRGKRGQAAQVYKTLRTLVSFALKDRGYIETNPMANVANPKPYNPRNVTPRAADDHDLRIFLKLLDSSKISIPIRLSVELLLLTGVRPGEVRGAKWEEIHRDRALWRIPAERVKTKKAIDVHLSPQALAVLEKARELDSPQGFVFSAARGGMASKLAMARAFARLSKELAKQRVERLRPHDLRRTFRTILSRIGVAPHIAERCLNHVDAIPLGPVYDAHDYREEMVAAWNRAGMHIEAIRAGAAEVVPIRQSA